MNTVRVLLRNNEPRARRHEYVTAVLRINHVLTVNTFPESSSLYYIV